MHDGLAEMVDRLRSAGASFALFGSRQEEARRLGRVLRPKRDGGAADFYTIVARETVAANRQRFLTEHGYQCTILDAHEAA
jgi:DNA excision repair protein ERCC-3